MARNYIAQARVLCSSFQQSNPDIEFVTLVIDGIDDDRGETGIGRVVLPADLHLDARTLSSMMTIYDVMELATALKPAVLSWLVRQGNKAVAYFDPDIRVYAALHDVFEQARSAGIVLTPHALSAVPRDGHNLTEVTIMQAGIYNLGFIAVGAQAYSFLSWWHERLTVDAIVDVENALFTDQRWIDWVPALFEHTISRDQGLNAAYWNLHERTIRQVDGRWQAGKNMLRFFHFSGYDPETPWILSKHMGADPRTLLSANPELARLVDDYRAELVASGHPALRRTPYRLDTLPNGLKLTRRLRRFVRKVLIGVVALSAPPDPFNETEDFVRWLTTPVFGAGEVLLSPAEYAIWHDRADLQQAFADPTQTSGPAYRNWLAVDEESRRWLSYLASYLTVSNQGSAGPSGGGHPGVAQRERDVRGGGAASIERARKAFGWSVVAYANSELGVGEAGRRLASVIGRTGQPMELVSTDLGTMSRQNHVPRMVVQKSIGFENSVFCINADQMAAVGHRLGVDALRGRKSALWFWELSQFPQHFAHAADQLHEVWVTSAFTQAAVVKVIDKPVRLIRLPIEIPSSPTHFTRRSLGLPEGKFIFLTNMDYLSVYERKNPIGAILAYRAAFGANDGAVLVVKSINAGRAVRDSEHVRSVAHGRADIIFVDDYVSAAAMKAMIELADCYVSLHRSEGYGLNLADAMAHRTPTVATGYSGNLEFMTNETSRLVGYSLVEVGPHGAPYDALSFWADPDLGAAAEAMRALFDNPDSGQRLADRAFSHIEKEHSMHTAAAILKNYLQPPFGILASTR